MLLVGVGTAIAQQAVGIDAIQYYLIDVLDESGVKSERAQLVILILLGLVKLGFIFVGGKLFDKRGRRPLLFASLIGKRRERGVFCRLSLFDIVSRSCRPTHHSHIRHDCRTLARGHHVLQYVQRVDRLCCLWIGIVSSLL
jgi:MFS family permease